MSQTQARPGPSTRPALASLTGLRGVLRRRYAYVLLGILLGVLLGVLLSRSIDPPTHSATVVMEVLPTGVDLSSRSTTPTYLDRARTRILGQDVLAAAAAEFDAPLDVPQLREAATAEQLADGPLLALTVEHPDVEVAVDAAAAVAAAYLTVEERDATAARDARVAEFRQQLDRTYAEIGALGMQLDATDDSARRAALEGQHDAQLRQVAELTRAVLQLQRHNVDPGRVARPAAPELQPTSDGRVLAVPGATALGLLLGLLAALLADRLDSRVWEPDDITRATGATTVVHVPREDLSGEGLRTGGGHRRLRTLVAPAAVTSGSVLVTGASADHGAGIAAGLAVAVAASGRRSVLMDAADADAFDLPGGDLQGWLAGSAGLDRAARSPAGVTSLQVLHGQPQMELSASSTLRELLSSPHAVVVLHAPGGSESGDALALAELVDHVVVVAAARQDPAEVVTRTHRWLARDARHEPIVVLAG